LKLEVKLYTGGAKEDPFHFQIPRAISTLELSMPPKANPPGAVKPAKTRPPPVTLYNVNRKIAELRARDGRVTQWINSTVANSVIARALDYADGGPPTAKLCDEHMSEADAKTARTNLSRYWLSRKRMLETVGEGILMMARACDRDIEAKEFVEEAAEKEAKKREARLKAETERALVATGEQTPLAKVANELTSLAKTASREAITGGELPPKKRVKTATFPTEEHESPIRRDCAPPQPLS
jgi:hypothetical protein